MFRPLTLLTLLPVVALAGGDESFTGEGTSYTLGQVSSGNCNFMHDPGVGENYAALNNEQWESTQNCGRCAEVSCDDSRCSDTTTTETVYLVDRCPECKKGDLDLSPTVFKKLTGSDPSRYKIKWKFTTCPVKGNIKYCTKSGSSSSWLAIQPANFATGVASIKIADQDVTMVDSCYFYLLAGGSNVDMSAVNVELTSISGEIVTEKLSLKENTCTDGTSNFGGSAAQGTVKPASSPTITPTSAAPEAASPTPPSAAPEAASPTPPSAAPEAAPPTPPSAAPETPATPETPAITPPVATPETPATTPPVATPETPAATPPVSTPETPSSTVPSAASPETFDFGSKTNPTQSEVQQSEVTGSSSGTPYKAGSVWPMDQSGGKTFLSPSQNSHETTGTPTPQPQNSLKNPIDYNAGKVSTTQANAPSTTPTTHENQFSGSANPIDYKAGKVLESEKSTQDVSILQSDQSAIQETKETDAPTVEQVSTMSAAESNGTSPIVVALIVAAIVGVIALAVVAYIVKKKQLVDKQIDRDEAMIRAFDSFSSPVEINTTDIARI